MRDNRLRSPFPWLLTAILVVAALLRIGGPLSDARVQHPDEFHFVYWPLYFTTGDLDPQHTLTAFYPALHYYLLGLLYFVYFLLQLPANGWSLEQFAMYHFFGIPIPCCTSRAGRGLFLPWALWPGLPFLRVGSLGRWLVI